MYKILFILFLEAIDFQGFSQFIPTQKIGPGTYCIFRPDYTLHIPVDRAILDSEVFDFKVTGNKSKDDPDFGYTEELTPVSHTGFKTQYKQSLLLPFQLDLPPPGIALNYLYFFSS